MKSLNDMSCESIPRLRAPPFGRRSYMDVPPSHTCTGYQIEQLCCCFMIQGYKVGVPELKWMAFFVESKLTTTHNGFKMCAAHTVAYDGGCLGNKYGHLQVGPRSVYQRIQRSNPLCAAWRYFSLQEINALQWFRPTEYKSCKCEITNRCGVCGDRLEDVRGLSYECRTCNEVWPKHNGFPEWALLNTDFWAAKGTFTRDDMEEITFESMYNLTSMPVEYDSVKYWRNAITPKFQDVMIELKLKAKGNAFDYALRSIHAIFGECSDIYQIKSQIAMMVNVAMRYDKRHYRPVWRSFSAAKWMCVESIVSEVEEPVIFRGVEVEVGNLVPETANDMAAVAPHLVVKRRGTRAGRRVKEKQPGYCYAKLAPRRMRTAIMGRLGKAPTIQDLRDALEPESISKNYLLRKVRKDRYHVLYCPNWGVVDQLDWMCDNGLSGMYVGAEADEWTDLDDMMALACDETTDIAAEFCAVSHLHVETPKLILERAEREEVLVRAPGHCWRKLPFTNNADCNWDVLWNENKMTSSKLADMMEKENVPGCIGYNTLVYFEEQEDGDVHVAGVGTKFTIKRAYKNLMDHPEKWRPLGEFITFLRTKRDKLVGSSLDQAMLQFTVPEVRRNNESMMTNGLAIAVKEVDDICPWAIPKRNQIHADDLCIPYSRAKGRVHSHPIHAALRRRQLIEVFPKYINADVTTYSMTESNSAIFEPRIDHEVKSQNPLVDLKDLGRFAGRPDLLPARIFSTRTCDTPIALFHDSGHYLTGQFLLNFFENNPSMNVAIISFVYPLDLLTNGTSTRPGLYDYVISDDKNTMVYIPEGDAGGWYEQPVDPLILLANEISDKNGRLKLKGGIVDSRLNSHVMVWTRFHLQSNSYVPVKAPEIMNMPRLFRGMPKDLMPVRVDDYVRMFRYAKTVPATDKDYWAKLRTYAHDINVYCPVGDVSWFVKVVEAAVKIEATADLQSKEYNSLSGELYYKSIGHVVRWMDKCTKSRYANRHRKLINEPAPYTLLPTIKLQYDFSNDGVYGTRWDVSDGSKTNFVKMLDYHFGKLLDWTGLHHYDLDDRMRLNPLFLHSDWMIRKQVPWRRIEESQIAAFNRSCGISPPLPERKEVLPAPIDRCKICKGECYFKEHAPDPDELPLVEGHRLPGLFKPKEMKTWMLIKMLLYLHVRMNDYAHVLIDEQDPPEQDLTINYMLLFIMLLSERPSAPSDSDSDDSSGSGSGSSSDSGGGPDGPGSDTDATEFSSEEDISPPQASEDGKTTCDKCPMHAEILGMFPQFPIGKIHEAQLRYHVIHQLAHEKDREIAKNLWTRDMNRWRKGKDRLFGDPEDLGQTQVPITPPDVPMPMADKPKGDKREVKWEAANEAWEKIRMSRPKGIAQLARYRGKELWDCVFQTSVDKRYHEKPTNGTTSYPDAPYPKNDCLIEAVYKLTGMAHHKIFLNMLKLCPSNLDSTLDLPVVLLDSFGCEMKMGFKIVDKTNRTLDHRGIRQGLPSVIMYDGNHCTAQMKRRGMILREPKRPEVVCEPREFLNMIRLVESLPMVNFVKWTPEPSRASLYVRAMWDGTTGLLGKKETNRDMLKSWDDNMKDMLTAYSNDRYLAVVEGEPGCRKSSPIQRILAKPQFKKNHMFSAILATNVLAQDWKGKLAMTDKLKSTGKGAPANFCSTLETALANQFWGWLTVTDEDKYPKGYHALFALLFPWVRYHLFLCDRYQTTWHEPNRDCTLNSPDILGNGEFYAQYNRMYLMGTWRFGPNIANFFRMFTFNGDKGGFRYVWTKPQNADDLAHMMPHLSSEEALNLWETRLNFVASDAAASWQEQMSNADVDTFAGSQGLGGDLAIIEIDHRTLRLVSYRMLYTVLTRAKEVILWLNFQDDGINKAYIDDNALFRELLWYRTVHDPGQKWKIRPDHTIDIRALCPEIQTPKSLKLHGPPEKLKNEDFVKCWHTWDYRKEYLDPDAPVLKAGRLRIDEPVYVDQPNFKQYIDERKIYDPLKSMELGVQINDMPAITHLPKIDLQHVFERHNEGIAAPEDRELSWKGLYSHQIPDEYMFLKSPEALKRARAKVAPSKLPRVERFKILDKLMKSPDPDNPLKFKPNAYSWGLQQRSDDYASFKAGIAQRVRVSDYETNYNEYAEHQELGRAMWQSLCEYCGWDPNHRGVLTDEQMDAYIVEFQVRRGERSEQLKKMSLQRADADFVDVLSAKNQWKLKERVSKEAKPLQPLLVRSDEYLFKWGWVGVAVLDFVVKNLPPNIYLHAKKTIEDMQNYVAEYFSGEVDYEILDMSGLDGTVRGEGMYLIAGLMNLVGIPQNLIDDYIEDKLNFHTISFVIGLMTLSGELWTYLINSFDELARELLKYHIPRGTPIMISGDDLLRPAGFPIKSTWEYYRQWDFKVEKRDVSKRGEFCSFIISKGILLKDPIILYRRLMGHLEAGKVDDIALGYFELFSTNYKLKDSLFEHLNEEELEHVTATNWVMMNLRKYGYRGKLPWKNVMIGPTDVVDARAEMMIVETFAALEETSKEESFIDDVANSLISAMSY
nr:MAG: polyprotein [Armillaria ostoyae RNA virus 1]